MSSIVTKITSLVSTLWCNLPLILLAILGISFLIILHELGHFLFAKLFNVRTPSFSIGFGPRVLEKEIGDTTFAIKEIALLIVNRFGKSFLSSLPVYFLMFCLLL